SFPFFYLCFLIGLLVLDFFPFLVYITFIYPYIVVRVVLSFASSLFFKILKEKDMNMLVRIKNYIWLMLEKKPNILPHIHPNIFPQILMVS
ncbi:hypothetical protein ACJX0J_013176, partial [Zea mays]